MENCGGRLPALKKSMRDEKGQTLVEYGLVLLLIAVVLIVAIGVVAQKTNNMYSTIGSSVPQSP
ncbi:MAG: Flp family type IVb pilin [Geobacteraceae bacterium]|nr:Flp family type IVb pilin [Geobacteraceae bacterium]